MQKKNQPFYWPLKQQVKPMHIRREKKTWEEKNRCKERILIMNWDLWLRTESVFNVYSIGIQWFPNAHSVKQWLVLFTWIWILQFQCWICRFVSIMFQIFPVFVHSTSNYWFSHKIVIWRRTQTNQILFRSPLYIHSLICYLTLSLSGNAISAHSANFI